MVLHTRRVITPVEDISARTSPLRRRTNPVSSRSTLKPLQVSFATPSARRPLHHAGVAADKSAPQSSPIKAQTDLPEKSSPFLQQSPNQVDNAGDDGLIPAIVKSSSNEEKPLNESIYSEHEAAGEDDSMKEDQSKSQDRLHAVADSSESGINKKRGSGSSESYYEGQSKSDHDQDVGMDMGEERVGRSHERKPKLNHQEWRSMASFAKAQGVDLMRQVEEQKRQRLEDDQEPTDIAKAELEEMRRILQERRRRSSDEYLAPSETERGSSPEINSRRERDDSVDQYSRRGAAEVEINDQIDTIKNEDPSKVLDWLKSADEEMDNCIAVSEDRTLSLLQAIKENKGFVTGSLGGIEGDWVSKERLREAERRSSIAEEQIRQFEGLLNAAEGVDGDEQLRVLLSRSKSMERHFNHLKKFAEDRHAELRKLSLVPDKDTPIAWRPHSGASPEKVRKDLQEHENHKKRLMQVCSVYNDLLKFVRIEHSKRVEAESKSQQLTSQIKRQTAALKKAEKVIKHTTWSPRAHESSYLRGTSHPQGSAAFPSFSPFGIQSPAMASYPAQPPAFSFSDVQSRVLPLEEDKEGDLVKGLDSARFDRSMPTLRRINTTGKSNLRAAALPSSATPSTPMTVTKQLSFDHALEQALSRNASPDPGAVLSNSDLIAQNHKKEFEDLERALIEEGRSKGFADVDLYSEKKTVRREETCWEYRHVHFDFVRPQQAGSPSSASLEQKWDTLDLQSVSNLPMSKRTTSPSRSEGAIFDEKQHHTLTDGGLHKKPLDLIPGTSHHQRTWSNVGEHDGDRDQQKQRQQDEISAKLVDSARTEKENALARIHHEGVSEKGSDMKSNETVKVEQIIKTSSAKHLDGGETIDKQKKVYRRMLSSPAKIMSPQTQNSPLLHSESETGKSMLPLALGDAAIVDDDVFEDVLQDALDNMWADVGKDERWSYATAMDEALADVAGDHSSNTPPQAHRQDERLSGVTPMEVAWADMAGDHSTQMTPEAHPTSNNDVAVHTKTERLPVRQRSSDLRRRVAAVESSHLAHLLLAQVKQRRRLLLFQIVLLVVVALLWTAPWQQSGPPPT